MPVPSYTPSSPADAASALAKYRSNANVLSDPRNADEARLKAAQDISENFEVINSNHSETFVTHAVPLFLKVLQDEKPQFIAESHLQLLRKLILELLHRMPNNEVLGTFVQPILELMFHLIETENEENVLVCLRVIIELHKQYRPVMLPEIQKFLQFVKQAYKDIPHNVRSFLPEVLGGISTPDPLNIQLFVDRTGFASQTIITIQQPDGTKIQQTILPKGTNSLKVLAEYPIMVVLMYQLYKQHVHGIIAEFIPLIMSTIVLQINQPARPSPNFKEMYVDFVTAQIKTLSFLAYIIKIYQEMVSSYATQMVKGILGLFQNCPSEVTLLRKDLLIATRHILATDLRTKFVPNIDKFFDENVLVGKGWTSKESLRPIAYSTLADLVHHVRQHLPLQHLSMAVQLFSKNVHDESLPCNIQTMSCKLLLNLVECIMQKSDQDASNAREILMRMLEVFVLKFQTIADNMLPTLFAKCRQPETQEKTSMPPPPTPSHGQRPPPINLQATQAATSGASGPLTPGTPSRTSGVPTSVPGTPTTTTASSSETPQTPTRTTAPSTTPGVSSTHPLLVAKLKTDQPAEEKPKMYVPSGSGHYGTCSVTDCRSLVKTVVCGVKTITWGISSCKGNGVTQQPVKQLQPRETMVFIKLVKHTLRALDIYQIQVSANGQMTIRPPNMQSVRLKEEKEVLEHFASLFPKMHALTFREIFQTTIDHMVESIYRNYALQIIANSFLANVATSATFATILVEYLLERMEEMGTNQERSNLYLKLFKLVFGSVSLFAAENEQMLKPHLHKIVNRSMELATTAKEPYNYFLLLRALFRSIGGGSHDLLYQEFLPLLPNLLQGLNQLQSGLHKQHMKDLFVELCLTVPVRLSSLLPYLPMLMDPLVSALNGSQILISQGLRTLELCVDNLQPDFLYEHIQPVRADLMQALWRTLRDRNDQIAHVAFRVLGKLGGGNRKMLKEPQRLKYKGEDNQGPCIPIYFAEKGPIHLPVAKVIETALNKLKSPTTEGFYRRQAWEVVRHFIIGMIDLSDDRKAVQQLFQHQGYKNGDIMRNVSLSYKCQDTLSRTCAQQALTAMIVAATIKDLRNHSLPFMLNIVRHFTLVTVAQQAGPLPMCHKSKQHNGLDPHVLIDAIATCMAHEEKELCKPGQVALNVILDTAAAILGSKYRACQLPIFEYVSERMCSCCYERAWYAKLGGCCAIKIMMEKLDRCWVLSHLYQFLKALLFVMLDLTGEVSSGALDMAKTNLANLLKICAKTIEGKDAENKRLVAAQQRAFYEVTRELVKEVTSPNQTVREQAMHSLQSLATLTGKTVTDIMLPHKEVLADMIPPKKHLLRHQPANAQRGLMDSNTFCTTLEPRLFKMNLQIAEHKVFFMELMNLCELEDSMLVKLPCYKSVPSLVPLRVSALKALSACHYIPEARERIFKVLYTALNSTQSELQEAGAEAMKKFIAGHPVEMELIHSNVRPLLLMLGDHRSLNLNMIQRLHSLTELFPDAFSEKLCEQMLAHLKKWLEATIMAQKTGQTPKAMENIKICTAILNIFHAIPAASAKQLETMLVLIGQAEMALSMEAGSPFREPLLKFLLRYPKQSIDLFLVENTLKKQQRSRMLIYFLKQKEAEPLRKVLEANTPRIINLAFAKPQPPARPGNITEKTLLELQYQSIYICRILVKYNPDWLPKQPQLCNHLRRIWISDSFQERHINDNVSISHWNEPKLLAKCLINYAEQHPDNVELVFQLLRVFIKRYMPNFQFVREFIEEKIAKGYVVEQKRKVFFTFVALYMDKSSPQELIAAALQYVIIPMFAASFDKGEGDELIGGPPNPSQNSPDNLVSVFISKVIDPDNPHGTSDALRILLLQFGALLVEKAAPHIHDTADKRQGSKLRRLMTFAWPCLIQKNCVDPTTKYYGHLLLSHTIAKFAIHKKIVLKVFHSLLKAHALEAKGVVRQALDILTPVLPQRMEDGNTMLMHWTKKIIVEEGYTTAQLVHMLQLINRHYKVYYPVRHHLIQTIVYSIQRLGYTQNSTLEHRKLVVDLVEVIIKWELQRIKDEEQSSAEQSGGEQESKRPRHGSSSSPATTTKPSNDPNRQVDKVHSDSVVNFLIRLACQVNESGASVGSPGEQLSRRCMGLLKMALRPEVWPLSDLRLSFLDKIFSSIDQPTQINFGNICAGLDVLNFLLTIMDKQAILSSLKPLQRGIVKCMTCDNTKVIRSVHSLLVRLMGIFPTESSTSSIASKFEELETLYAGVGKIIYEGLTAYEKAANGTPTPRLFGTLMILKAACTNNISYIDRLISVFMRALQKMAREHLSPSTTEPNSFASELLVISLDLVKNRVCVMSTEMRRNFVHSVLASLIEKSADAKVLKTIVRMVEEWVKAKTPAMINQSFSPKEKTVLLVKLMQYVEKRFPDEADLNAQFLELVNWVYRDEALAGSELTSKLEPAFLAGLRCPQPLIRAKFFDVFNTSIRRRLFDRLLYIIDSQNWEAMGTHYWLKQCMELVLVVSLNGPNITTINSSQLPAICNVINLADSQEKTAFQLATHVKEEPMETDSDSQKEEDVEIDIEITQPETPTTTTTTTTPSTVAADASNKPPSDPKLMLQQFLFRSRKFIENLREVKTINFLAAFSQLCHSDTELTNELWIHLFPQIWKILSEKEQATLSQEMGPFLCSGSHHYQKEAPHSVIKTMMEAISKCVPPITIRPCVTKYLGKSHNLWHRSILMLEQSAIESGFSSHHRPKNVNVSVYDFYEPDNAATTQKETLDSLAELYERLEEEDMWAGLWQKRCKFPETATAISFEQQGFFEQAQGCYEQAMTKARAEHNNGPANPAVFPEYQLWENHWIRCSKELSQWDLMMEYGNTKGNSNPHLVLESAWRVPNWNAMKEALAQVELSCPREMNWKVNMYRGFIAICHPEEKNLTLIDKLVEMSSNQAVKEWRRLPTYITQAHMPLLQAAQRIMELQEAAQVHHGLQPTNVGRTQSLHDMKAIVKTWRNRLPMISDDLSHWSDIFMWRQHHYQAIVSAYENQASQDSTHANHAMLGVHASAQSIINYGKMARKHNLIGSALDSLSRIHTIPSVPIVDCFQKIRQQVKCYLQMAGTMGKQELQEGLEVIESTNLKYFGREMKAEFYALKGMFLAQVGRSDEANKAFSAAVQMHDILVKAWALWGNYLEQIFCKDRSSKVGESAIVCFLHACRHQNTGKSRKYLAKVLWLLSYEDDKTGYTLAKAVETYTVGVPPSQWLPWIPQLLTCLKSKIGEKIMNILLQIGKVYPQALYFPIRTLYLTLKIEHREKWKSAEPPNSQQRVSSTLLKVSQKLAVVAANNEPPAAAQNTNDTEKSTTAEPTSTAQTVTTVAASNTVTATTTTSAAVTNVTKATTGTVVAGGTSAVSTTAATTSATVTTTSAAAIKNTTAATTSTSKTAATTSTASGLGASSASTTGPIKASIQMVRCSKIMQVQRDLHPILLYSLEGIVDQMVWFRERWDEEVLRQLKLALTKCQAVAFENRGAVIDAKVTPHTHSFVKKLVKTFGVGFENVNSVATTFSTAASELWSRRVQATAQDPIFQKLKTQFTSDFNFDIPGAMKLHNLIGMLKKWVKVMEARSKLGPKSFLIEDKCRFLSNFSSATADVELPGEFLTPKHSHYNIRIARFMPRAEIVHKHNTAARRLYIRGSNGKIYPYLVVNDASMGESRREERVLQLLRMLNQFLAKRKETAKRQLQFTVPKVVAVSPQMRLVEDSPSSVSLLDIYKEWSLKHKVEFDAPISKYYDRLAVVQSRGSQVSHQVLRDILKDVQSNMVPRSMLKEWAMRTFPTATDYFSFRKMFTGQLALLGLAEFILHLTRLNPEILQVERNSGLLSVFYFKFDIDDSSGELDANRPVPFRLTPNVAEFLTTVGVNGVLTASMIATARCLVQPSFQLSALLKAILRDEIIAWDKKKREDTSTVTDARQIKPEDIDCDLLITTVTKAVGAIMTRLQNLAQFEGGESKVSTLVAAANSPDNLCRMDPAWHPWL